MARDCSTDAIASTGLQKWRNGGMLRDVTMANAPVGMSISDATLPTTIDFVPNRYFGEDNGVGQAFQKQSANEIAAEHLNKYLIENPAMRIGNLYRINTYSLHKVSELMNLDI